MRKNVAEEYLETILYLTKRGRPAKTKDIADAMRIKPPSVSEMLTKLKEEGYIEYQPYAGASLTERGKAKAIQMERKHQVLETFLVDALGVELEKAHDEACEMEHTVSDSTLSKMCAFLGHPRFCPDNHPIPMGVCCEKSEESVPLTKLKEGEGGIIKIVCVDKGARDYLLSLGFLPDIALTVKKRLPPNSLLVRIKGAEIAIDGDIAKKIFVKKASTL